MKAIGQNGRKDAGQEDIEQIEERPDPELDDTRRRYYRLSNLGSRVLDAETTRLTDLVRAARATKAIRKLRPA